VDQEAVMLKQYSTENVKKEFINTFKAIKESHDFQDLLQKCVTILSLNYKWFRHNEVPGVSFSSVIKSLLLNKQNSRPLGARNLTLGSSKDRVYCSDE
jgi:hypothetical protein